MNDTATSKLLSNGGRILGWVLLMTLASAVHAANVKESASDKSRSREQLSIGYSLLYEEADGIPKLKWILMLKDKPEQMGQVTHDLVSYYQQLADTMQRLSKQIPAMRINAKAMSDIEAAARKSLGEDTAKDLAPLIGKKGTDFERETLMMFFNALNEQRHLVKVMLERESEPALRKFLETTQTQLDEHYNKVSALLDKRYFKH